MVLDEWIVELFLELFDTMGPGLLDVVEESKMQCRFIGAINATFIDLIPKNNNHDFFDDFRSISMWNLVYKIISKIIATKINHMLYEFISKERFIFLDNHQILDAIGVVRECLHSIKFRKQKGMMLKLYLVNPYEKVSWDFLRLVLL